MSRSNRRIRARSPLPSLAQVRAQDNRIRTRSRSRLHPTEEEEPDEVEEMLQSRGQSVRQRLDFRTMPVEHPLLDAVTTTVVPLNQLYDGMNDDDHSVDRLVSRGTGPVENEEEHDDDPASRLPPYPIGRNLTNPTDRSRYIRHVVNTHRPTWADLSLYDRDIRNPQPLRGDVYPSLVNARSVPLPSVMPMSDAGPALRSEFDRFRGDMRQWITDIVAPMFSSIQRDVADRAPLLQSIQNHAAAAVPPPIARESKEEEEQETKASDLDPTNSKIIDILSKCLDICDLCDRWNVPGMVYLHDKYRPNAPGNNPACLHKACMGCYLKLQPQRVSDDSNPNLKMKLCPYCRQRIYPLAMPEESTTERRIAWQKIALLPLSPPLPGYTRVITNDRVLALGIDINPDVYAADMGIIEWDLRVHPGIGQLETQPSAYVCESNGTFIEVNKFLCLFRAFLRHMDHAVIPKTPIKAVYYYLIQLRADMKEVLDDILSSNTKFLDLMQFILSPIDLDGERSNIIIRDWIQDGEMYNLYGIFYTLIEQDQRGEDEEEKAQEHALPLQSTEPSEVISVPDEEEKKEEEVVMLEETFPDRIQYDGEWHRILSLDETCFVGDKNEVYPFPLHHPTLAPCILPDRHTPLELEHFYMTRGQFYNSNYHQMYKAMKRFYTDDAPSAQHVNLPRYDSLPPLLKYYIFWAYECFENRASINEWRLPLLRVYNNCRMRFYQYRLHLFQVYLNLFRGHAYHTFFYRLIIGRNAQLFSYMLRMREIRYECVMKYLEACHFLTRGDTTQVSARQEYWDLLKDLFCPPYGTQSDRQILLAITTNPEELYTLPL